MAQKFKNQIDAQEGIKITNELYDGSNAAGTSGQVLSSTGTGTQWIDSSSETAERTEILVKNVEGSSLVKGDPVYIVGSVGASARLEVGLCDSSDSSKMPCVGLLTQNLANNGEGTAIVTGKLKNLVTSPIDGVTPTENDTLFVKPGGSSGSALTTTKPTATNHLIQNIGQVGRVSTSSDGNIVVSAIMRTNDVPNQIDRNVNFTDNSRLTFGSSTTPNLQIYHDTNNSWVRDTNDGNLYLDTNGNFIGLVSDASFSNGKMGLFYKDGAVELYYDNSKKFETTSTGVTITGRISGLTDPSAAQDAATKAYVDSQVGANNELSEVLANGNTTGGTDISVSAGDNITFTDTSVAYFGSGNDLSIEHSGTLGQITNSTGHLYIQNGADNSDIIFRSDNGSGGLSNYILADGSTGAVNLYHYGSKKFETTSTGAKVTGDLYVTGAFLDSNNSSGTADQVLVSTGTGTDWQDLSDISGVDGTGTANTVTMWSDTDTITDAPITISGNNATFAGSIVTQDDSNIFGGSGAVPLYLRSTGTVSYAQFQTSSTGNNGTNDGLSVGVNGTTAYVWQRENASLYLGTNNTLALTLDNSQNATFAGTLSSGTQTITSSDDQILTLDQTGGGWNYIGFQSDGTRNFYVGQDSSENFVIGADTSSDFSFVGFNDIKIQGARIINTGNILPNVDSTYNLGSTSLRWANIYGDNLDVPEISVSDYIKIENGNSTYSVPAPANTNVPLLYIRNSNNAASTTTAHALITLRTQINGGDPFISFDVENETGWTAGMDNSDNNFKITTGWSDVGSGTGMAINTSGQANFYQNVLVGNTSSGTGSVNIATDSNSGWGTTSYPYIGSNGSSLSLIFLHNPHTPFRTDNVRSGASGRSGLRMARDASGAWWDMGLIGDEWEIYRNGTGQLMHISNTGNTTFAGTISNSGYITTTSTANEHLKLAYNANYDWRIYREGTPSTGDLVMATNQNGTVSEALRIKVTQIVETPKMISVRGGNLSSSDLTTYNNPSVTSANLGTYANQYAFLDLSSSNSDGSWIDFSNTANDFSGRIRYFLGSLDEFRFYTAGANVRLKISSDGLNIQDDFHITAKSSYQGFGWNRNVNDGTIFNSGMNAFQMFNDGDLKLQGYNSSGTNQFEHIFYNNGDLLLDSCDNLYVEGNIYTTLYLTSTYSFSSNRNWAWRTNTFGAGNWGGLGLWQSASAGTNATSGVQRFGIDRVGNVGMGYFPSNTPIRARLHVRASSSEVYGNTDANNVLYLERDSHAYMLFAGPDNTDQGFHFLNSTDNTFVGRLAYKHSSSGDEMAFRVGQTSGDVMSLMSGGGMRLYRSSDPYIQFYEGSSNVSDIFVDTSLNSLVLRGAAGHGVHIKSNGNTDASSEGIYLATNDYVGINTKSPATYLSVNNGSYFVNIGSASFSWAGSTAYPTIYGSHQDRWVMYSFPHIVWLQNGVNGYTGTTWGSIIRFASQSTYTNYWDAGVSSDYTDKFVIRRQGGTPAITADNTGRVGLKNTGPYADLEINCASRSFGEGIVLNPDTVYGWSALFFRLEGATGSNYSGTWFLGKQASGQTGGQLLQVGKEGLTGGALSDAKTIQRWYTNGNVGFGFNVAIGTSTTTPDERLVVDGNVKVLKGDDARIYINDVGDSSIILLRSDGANTSIGTSSNHDLQIHTNDSQRMRIDTSGRVGINQTPATDSILSMVSSYQYGLQIGHNNANSASDFQDALFVKNTNNNNSNYVAIGMSTNGSDGQHHRVQIRAYRGGSNYEGQLRFYMRQPTAANTEKYRFYANGEFHADSDIVAFSTTISDQRLKDEVVTIDSALDKVKRLRGVEYVWNSGSKKGKKDLGVIAQEVEEILPEIVTEKEMAFFGEEKYKTVDYEKLTAVLIESVKELSAKVEALENKKCNCK